MSNFAVARSSFVADFTQVVEGPLRVDTALFEKLRAQLKTLFLAGRDARVEEAEEVEQERHAFACGAGKVHREPDVEESLANRVEARTPVLRVLVGAEVVGIGETLEKRRRLLLAHAHARGNGGRRLLLVAHARQTFQQRALTGWQVVQPALIERRDSVEQQVELILHAGDRLVGDQLVEHHRQPRVSPRHAIEGLQSRAHVVQDFENVRAFFPFEIQADDFNRFLKAQVLQDLNVEEVIERLSHVGDAVEMQRCGGHQQAAVVGHEKFAQGGNIALVANLPGKDLA